MTVQSKLRIPFSEGTHVQEHLSTWQSDTTVRTNVTTFQTEAPYYYKYRNQGANIAAKSKFENLLKVF